MRIAVGLAGSMVMIIGAFGAELLEPFFHVPEETVLVVIDIDAGGDVHGGDQDKTFLDLAFFDDLLNFVGEINDFSVLFGIEPESLGV